jgi:hypothetical protein
VDGPRWGERSYATALGECWPRMQRRPRLQPARPQRPAPPHRPRRNPTRRQMTVLATSRPSRSAGSGGIREEARRRASRADRRGRHRQANTRLLRCGPWHTAHHTHSEDPRRGPGRRRRSRGQRRLGRQTSPADITAAPSTARRDVQRFARWRPPTDERRATQGPALPRTGCGPALSRQP